MGSVVLTWLLVLLFNYLCVALNILPKFLAPTCRYDSDCGQNAYCKNNTNCVCKDGYLPFDHNVTFCLKEALAYGDSCTNNIQCTAAFGTKAECFIKTPNATGQCRCNSKSHFYENICYPSVSIGGNCQASGECKVKSNVPVYCDAGKCTCPFYYHPNSDGSDCFPSYGIGDPCHNDSDCTTVHSRCFGVCRCKVDYVLSNDGKRCLSVVDSFNSSCEENGQCQEYLQNSVCDPVTKQCTCTSVSIFRDGSCWNIVELGDKCSDSRECVIQSKNIGSVKCLNQTCRCISGYKANLNTNDCTRGISSALFSGFLSFNLLLLSNLMINFLNRYSIIY